MVLQPRGCGRVGRRRTNIVEVGSPSGGPTSAFPGVLMAEPGRWTSTGRALRALSTGPPRLDGEVSHLPGTVVSRRCTVTTTGTTTDTKKTTTPRKARSRDGSPRESRVQ